MIQKNKETLQYNLITILLCNKTTLTVKQKDGPDPDSSLVPWQLSVSVDIDTYQGSSPPPLHQKK